MDETASSDPILWRIDDRGVAYITLNRPQVYNAYNGEMIAGLLASFDKACPRAVACGLDQRQRT
jgi:enoyl-CoA hydratase/carnithine racemase